MGIFSEKQRIQVISAEYKKHSIQKKDNSMSSENFPAKANPSENHHTVPRFYLKGFANDKSLIHTTQFGLLPYERRSSVKKASVIRGFYNIPEEIAKSNDVGTDHFENWLGKNIENPAAPILAKIVNEDAWFLGSKDRHLLATFIAAQFLRTEKQRRKYHYAKDENMAIDLIPQGKDSLQVILRDKYNTIISDHEVDTVWNLVLQGKFHQEVRPLDNISFINDNIEEATAFLMNRKWILVDFKGMSLFTSDDPVYLTHLIDCIPSDDGKTHTHKSRPSGLSNAPTILFPLSRRKGLVMLNQKSIFDERVDGDQETHQEFVKNIINSAYRELYYHPDDSDMIPQDLSPIVWNDFVLPKA